MTEPEEPNWLRIDVVCAIHRRQLAEHGGPDGVRDLGLLESALERPRQTWSYDRAASDIPRLAARYAHGLIRNHPFVDGNKRTAYVACRLFLLLNGTDLEATKEEKFLTFMELAEGRMGEGELTAWLRARIVPARRTPRGRSR